MEEGKRGERGRREWRGEERGGREEGEVEEEEGKEEGGRERGDRGGRSAHTVTLEQTHQ